jgi:hypothetical protein
MTKPWARTELHFGKFTNILGNDRQHKLEKLRYELENILGNDRQHNDANVFDQD